MKKITDLYPNFAVTDRPNIPVCVDGNPSMEETWALLSLARLAHAKTALDLGTFNGVTAFMLASVVEHVTTVDTGYWPAPAEVLPLPENVTRATMATGLPNSADLVFVMVDESLLSAALSAAGADGVVVWHADTAARLAAGLAGYELYAMGDRMAVVKTLEHGQALGTLELGQSITPNNNDSNTGIIAGD